RGMDEFARDAMGAPLRTGKLGVLSDDYVRFFHWALSLVKAAPGGGVVAMVTNSSFLEGPGHRGMRHAILRASASVDVLDLGGSSLTARRDAPDGNLFGVRPGA